MHGLTFRGSARSGLLVLIRELNRVTGVTGQRSFSQEPAVFDIDEYDYHLPPELIAQVPCPERDRSRLCVVNRREREISDRNFQDLPLLLGPGDLLVVNDTRVLPARLSGRKASGGRVELLVLEHRPGHDKSRTPGARRCLMKSSKGPEPGTLLLFEKGLCGRVETVAGGGMVTVAFEDESLLDRVMEEYGHVPLPPYIRRVEDDPRCAVDRERYQTVYSRHGGSVAAPTAGLHFTDSLLDRVAESGARVVPLTLHVGYGTFRPVRVKDIRRHFLDEELFELSLETAAAINETRSRGGRIIAVGTTVVRVLETVGRIGNPVEPRSGATGLMITPGHKFRLVDGMITNFHLPRSSLLFLVSAFAGRDLIGPAYEHAIKAGYRFFSYGDAMFIV